MIPGFAEDGLSDMLTNILHDKLNTFTLKQIDKYGLHSNGYLNFMVGIQSVISGKR